jgi:glycerol kinase
MAVGFWGSFAELRANWGKDKEWLPGMSAEQRDRLYYGWKKAVTRTLSWVE